MKTLRWLILLVVAAAWPAAANEIRFESDSVVIVSGGARYPFDVELARTDQEHRQGLKFRYTVPEGTGMLFLYEPPQRLRMWMKDTLVPLDMLFLRPDGQIAAIAEWTVPLSETPIGPDIYVSGVLEVRGGTVEKLGLGLGDRVLHRHFGSRDPSR